MTSATTLEVGRAHDAHLDRRGRPVRERRARKLGGFLLLGMVATLEVASRAIALRRARGRQVIARLVGDAAANLGRGYLVGMFAVLSIEVAPTVYRLATETARARIVSRTPHVRWIRAITSLFLPMTAAVVGITAMSALAGRLVAEIESEALRPGRQPDGHAPMAMPFATTAASLRSAPPSALARGVR